MANEQGRSSGHTQKSGEVARLMLYGTFCQLWDPHVIHSSSFFTSSPHGHTAYSSVGLALLPVAAFLHIRAGQACPPPALRCHPSSPPPPSAAELSRHQPRRSRWPAPEPPSPPAGEPVLHRWSPPPLAPSAGRPWSSPAPPTPTSPARTHLLLLSPSSDSTSRRRHLLSRSSVRGSYRSASPFLAPVELRSAPKADWLRFSRWLEEMESSSSGSCVQGTVYHWVVLFAVWLCGSQHVLSQKTTLEPKDKFLLSDPPIGLFDPIEISPSVLPHNPNPVEPLSPMYPNYTSYDPVLTGKCHVNFSALSYTIDKTASDCSIPLAPLVADVICCPQVNSLMNIFQAAYGSGNDTLVLNQASANACFSDIMSILASKGANTNIPELCTLRPSNLTDAACPVKDITSFEKIVNVSKLIDACSSVDPLKECCRPVCQPAIAEAAIHISSSGSNMFGSSSIPGSVAGIDVVSDCKGVVHSWLSMKLSSEEANSAFRVLSGCKVNKVCPLEFDEPSSVVKACGKASLATPSCCAALHSYIGTRQKQIFVTNLQAINCATMFGSMLQKAGVVEDVYGLCDIDLKDFSLQAFGQQGCLLRSLPTDIEFDNTTGISFTCDLSDNIAAPWPSSSSVQSLSLCAPEMSLPALPVSPKSGSSGTSRTGIGVLLPLVFLTTTISI